MGHLGLYPKTRLRRLRQNSVLRNLVRETQLDANKLILPIFVKYGRGTKSAIASMPGHFQFSIDQLPDEIASIVDLGIKGTILFGVPETKDPFGKAAFAENGIIQSALTTIKQAFPTLLVLTDICFCEYTDHGHCGVIRNTSNEEVWVDNDHTLELLAKQAISHAKAGADVIAPSANMDGMVQAIRHALDGSGHAHVPVLSYSVKYASSLYAPFRQAAEGAPTFGDRRTYQMDIANSSEAVRECALDISEGADMLMVKPAHTYLDIVFRVKQAYPELPLCAYHTSGEYALLKAASQQGWINERESVLEVLRSIRRAGADFIITYFAKEAAAWLQDSV